MFEADPLFCLNFVSREDLANKTTNPEGRGYTFSILHSSSFVTLVGLYRAVHEKARTSPFLSLHWKRKPGLAQVFWGVQDGRAQKHEGTVLNHHFGCG